MKTQPTHRWIFLLVLCAASLAGCSGEEPTTPAPAAAQPTAPAAEPLEPLPALRTGTLPPLEAGVLKLQPGAWQVDATHQYVQFDVPTDDSAEGSLLAQFVALDNAAPGELALLKTEVSGTGRQLLIRRPLSRREQPVAGALYARRWSSTGPRYTRWTFQSAGTGGREDPGVRLRWIEAFAAAASQSGESANTWFQFAAGRIRALDPDGMAAADASNQTAPTRRSDLRQLMDTTSGMLSVQEALQHDRGLRLPASTEPADIAVATLQPPALTAHPFAQMRAALAKPDGGTPEPLAATVPADFWYARVDDLRLLLRLLDEADAWLTPLLQILESNPQDRALSARYQAQLGLKRSGMAKLFGHTVVGPVAITGSDPYLREGSDVTLIFTIKQQTIFDAELARHLAQYQAEHRDLTQSERQHGGIRVQVNATPDGHVRQQRAQVGDWAVVSNSARAMDRVLDAIAGTAPRLADEEDLRYLLARDPGTHQGLVFLSDRFIANVVGPAQKILAARRQQALAELLTPGYAALLHGWLEGQAPESVESLQASGLLAADELQHADGATIAFQPGQSARSVWGTPAALTPLLDLPPVTLVSASEQAAYRQFVETYQQYWRQFIDPVAVRIDLTEGTGGNAELALDVRILPLINGTDYQEIDEVVGTARVAVPSLSSGLQAVWAVGADARLRRELDGLLRAASSGGKDVGLGWLGDWVSVGFADRAALVELLSYIDRDVQLPLERAAVSEWEDEQMWQRVGRFPVYAAAEVKNPLGLVATLTALRTMVNQVAPGMIEWGEKEKYRELPIVRVGVNPNAPMLPNRGIADAIALHYLQTGSAFVIALDPATLKQVADHLLDGKAPQRVAEGAAQFVFDARTRRGAPLWTALLWMLQGQAHDSQQSARCYAEALLRGDPALASNPDLLRQRGLDYLGFAPLTAQGDSHFELRPAGAADQVSGSTVQPVYVDLPVPGSPVAALLERLVGLRGEVSFDAEPAAAGAGARSLHTRLQLAVAAPR